MHQFDIEDKCITNASAKTLYLALVDEADGKTAWWQPRLRIEKANEIPAGEVGFRYWLKITPLGRPRILAEMVEVQPYSYNRSKLIAGDFIGTLDWSFSESDNGTEISVRWQATPNSLLASCLSRFAPMSKLHSQTVQIGFRSLKRYLKKSSTQNQW